MVDRLEGAKAEEGKLEELRHWLHEEEEKATSREDRLAELRSMVSSYRDTIRQLNAGFTCTLTSHAHW